MEKEVSIGTLYDFNKQLFLKQKAMLNKEIESIKS